MDAELRMLIRMIRDYAPHLKRADLARKPFAELATIYRQLAGWEPDANAPAAPTTSEQA